MAEEKPKQTEKVKKEAQPKEAKVVAEEIKTIDNKTTETKKESAKPAVVVKDKAIVNGYSLKISPKYSKYVCRMITNKSVERAKEMLQAVIDGKLPVKMTQLEVPHQKGKGISGAKFPKETSKAILSLVEQLESNTIVNGIEEPVIVIAMPNRASEPAKRGGRHGKRAHIHMEAISKKMYLKNKKGNKN